MLLPVRRDARIMLKGFFSSVDNDSAETACELKTETHTCIVRLTARDVEELLERVGERAAMVNSGLARRIARKSKEHCDFTSRPRSPSALQQ